MAPHASPGDHPFDPLQLPAPFRDVLSRSNSWAVSLSPSTSSTSAAEPCYFRRRTRSRLSDPGFRRSSHTSILPALVEEGRRFARDDQDTIFGEASSPPPFAAASFLGQGRCNCSPALLSPSQPPAAAAAAGVAPSTVLQRSSLPPQQVRGVPRADGSQIPQEGIENVSPRCLEISSKPQEIVDGDGEDWAAGSAFGGSWTSADQLDGAAARFSGVVCLDESSRLATAVVEDDRLHVTVDQTQGCPELVSNGVGDRANVDGVLVGSLQARNKEAENRVSVTKAAVFDPLKSQLPAAATSPVATACAAVPAGAAAPAAPALAFSGNSAVPSDSRPAVRSATPSAAIAAIHKAAGDGRLESLGEWLRQQPGCINARSTLTYQTPLHTAAAAGQAAAVDFLLSWRDGDKADVDARSVLFETPLHMAVKNGHESIARALLSAGASTESRASNGMSPLHLAVWSAATAQAAQQTSMRGVVAVLLEHHADASAIDKSGKTPLDYAAMGAGSSNNSGMGNQKQQQQQQHQQQEYTEHNVLLKNMLLQHIELERRAQALKDLDSSPSSSGTAILEALEEELRRIVGLHSLKQQLRRWAKGVLLDRRRRALGIPVQRQCMPHMAFLGNPGTGKTTVARALARMLHRMGMLQRDTVVEVQRTDLVGEFVGHTGPKTRKVIERANGGVLFVDEAYRLVPQQRADEKDYGVEALEEIMSVMESGQLMVVFAGYTEPMQRVFAANEGFRRRVAKCFVFDDLSSSEIAQVALIKMEEAAAATTVAAAASTAAAGWTPAERAGITSAGQRSGGGAVTGVDCHPRGTLAGREPESDSDQPACGSTAMALCGFRLHPECTQEVLAEVIERHTTVEFRRQHNGGLALTMLLEARNHLDQRLDLHCNDAEALATINLCDIQAALHDVGS